METILMLVFLIAIGSVIYLIYKYFTGKKMIATDDMFQQRDVTVQYKAGTIQINKHLYPINKVTGVSLITNSNGRRNNYFAQIEVDDMVKPVHKIAVIGSQHSADEFVQRICVAIRKAGGTNFY